MLDSRARAALYTVAGIAFSLLTFYNVATREQANAWLLLISTALAVLSAVNTDRSNLWGVVRGGIYVLSAALFGVFAVYGLVNDQQTAVWLSAVQAVIPIFAVYNIQAVKIDRAQGLQDMADLDTETPTPDPEILP